MLKFSDYEIFYDGRKEGYNASGGAAIYNDGQIQLCFQKASDAEAGLFTYIAKSSDMGCSWTEPKPFGPEIIKDPANEFMAVTLFGPSPKGSIFSIGFHLKKGIDEKNYKKDIIWRPGTVIIGRKKKNQDLFDYSYFPSGSFLGEQFIAPGIFLSDGGIMLTVWGSKEKGENWRCGLLKSDDDGLTWNYSESGYEADLSIRNDPVIPAGYNEQSLFEAKNGDLISLIRGREALGRVSFSPKDTWFFCTLSKDHGQTWSKPQETNIPGTGAASSGITLSDGSLLHACRIPYSRKIYDLPEEGLFGLHIARSYDNGMTWHPELFKQHDPEGNPFDDYYNTMNGQFLKIDNNIWYYIFGQFDIKRSIHRILKIKISAA